MIARRRFHDLLRKKYSYKGMITELVELHEEACAEDASTEASLMDLYVFVKTALESLSPNQLLALYWRLAGLPNQEIAKRLNVTEGTTSKYFRTAKARLDDTLPRNVPLADSRIWHSLRECILRHLAVMHELHKGELS